MYYSLFLLSRLHLKSHLSKLMQITKAFFFVQIWIIANKTIQLVQLQLLPYSFVHHICLSYLTFFRLNKLPHTIYWKFPISVLGTCMSDYVIYIFLQKKMLNYNTPPLSCHGQITLSNTDEICTLAIPNQISLISMHVPSLIKIL